MTKPALDRDRIVTAAINLLDEDGAESFTMRRLGASLGVDPMAVYYHLPNKAAVFDAVVDQLLASIAVDLGEASTWQAIAKLSARSLRKQLLAHPRLIPLVATRPAVTPNLLRIIDTTLGRLASDGLPPAEAMRLLDCLVAFTVGKALQEAKQPVGGENAPREKVYDAISSDQYPNLTTAMSSGYDWDPEGEFEHGLRALVYGWRS